MTAILQQLLIRIKEKMGNQYTCLGCGEILPNPPRSGPYAFYLLDDGRRGCFHPECQEEYCKRFNKKLHKYTDAPNPSRYKKTN